MIPPPSYAERGGGGDHRLYYIQICTVLATTIELTLQSGICCFCSLFIVCVSLAGIEVEGV